MSTTTEDATLTAYVALLTHGKPVSPSLRSTPDDRPALTPEHLAACGLGDCLGRPAEPDPSWEVEGCKSDWDGCDGYIGAPTLIENVFCRCDDYRCPFLTWSPTPVEYARAILDAACLVAKSKLPTPSPTGAEQ